MNKAGCCVLASVLALAGCGGADERATACLAPDNAMIFIEGGSFSMGSDKGYPDERPVREATTGSFYIDAHEVTNDQFTAFVDATGYRTVAERTPDLAGFENVPPEMALPGSAVFRPPDGKAPASFLDWWRYAPGASWRAPEGPGSDINARGAHPVVHIAFEDAQAYAQWAGRRLPTETEWEYAARALSGEDSDISDPGETGRANTWQGVFPYQNAERDGYAGAAPVKCFPPNERGLYDMIGNVWEWTEDAYRPAPGAPAQQGYGVIKGGSYLCAASYCARYRPAARHAQDTGLGTNHIGFRTVKDADPRD